MKRALLAVLLTALLPVLASCESGGRRRFKNNDLVLVTSYTLVTNGALEEETMAASPGGSSA